MSAGKMRALAPLVGGVVTDEDRISAPAGLIYCSAFGRVRLEPHGKPVRDLGGQSAPAEALAQAYHAAVAS